MQRLLHKPAVAATAADRLTASVVAAAEPAGPFLAASVAAAAAPAAARPTASSITAACLALAPAAITVSAAAKSCAAKPTAYAATVARAAHGCELVTRGESVHVQASRLCAHGLRQG